MSKVRIVSDGTAVGTRLFDPDGKDITKYCTSIEWRIDAGGHRMATATVTFARVEIEAEGTVKEDGRAD